MPFGERYLAHLERNFARDDIRRLCAVNDNAAGGAAVHAYECEDGDVVLASPSTLRHLHHAWCVVSTFDVSHVVEVGGGYGGLALLLPLVATLLGKSVRSYRIYDLEAPAALQRAYLAAHEIDGPFRDWGDAATYGADLAPRRATVLVSAYCVSELLPEACDAYLANLVPQCDGLWMVWNSPRRSPFLPLGFLEEVEDPLTGPDNVIVVR
jgi:hypothetical protein